MSDFEKWFRSLNANGKTVYFLGNEHKVSEMAWNHQQAIIDDLKAQLNNMEACYIEKKKEAEDQQGRVSRALNFINNWWHSDLDQKLFVEAVANALRGES